MDLLHASPSCLSKMAGLPATSGRKTPKPPDRPTKLTFRVQLSASLRETTRRVRDYESLHLPERLARSRSYLLRTRKPIHNRTAFHQDFSRREARPHALLVLLHIGFLVLSRSETCLPTDVPGSWSDSLPRTLLVSGECSCSAEPSRLFSWAWFHNVVDLRHELAD